MVSVGRGLTVAVLLASGCGASLVPTEFDDSEDAGAPASSTSTGPVTPMSTTAVATTTTGAPSTDGIDGGSTTEVGSFVDDPDVGAGSECDLFAQDCPAGFKCMPWGSDGGAAWNATRCSPIVDNPGERGDPCTVVDAGNSGLDDCDLGLMCWDVDPRTLQGECIAICAGDEVNLVCEDPDSYCAVSGDGVLALCLPLCDPLTQDCPAGQGCYPFQENFSCAPDASGEMGVAGDGCDFVNDCDPGLFCLTVGTVPDCTTSVGCCSSACDLEDPNPPCLPGQECVAWFDEPTHPSYGSVGVCALPQ